MNLKNTKDRIIDAAIDQFSMRGYTETSMREISEHVGIRASSIYNHFPSKSAILDHIFNLHVELTKQSTIGVDELDELIQTEDARTILRRMFYVYPTEEAERYFKVLKIMLHEQYREKRAEEFMKDYSFDYTYKYIKTVLDRLMAEGKIHKVNTGVYARIFVAVTVATSVESVFYTYDEFAQINRERAKDSRERAGLNELLIDQLAKG